MGYVFDSNSFITLFTYYYLERFPTLWENFDKLVIDGRIVSVREVKLELQQKDNRLSEWVKQHDYVFEIPSIEEMNFVKEIFTHRHFQSIIRKKEQLNGKPVADPFVIARAKIGKMSVVTEEKYKPDSSRIPNICKAFNIPCFNLESFMEKEGWTF